MSWVPVVAAFLLAAEDEPKTFQLTVGLVRVSAHRPGSDKPWDRTQPKPQRDSCAAIDRVTSIAPLAGLIPGVGVAAVGAATVGKAASALCEQQRKDRAGADAPVATDPDLFVRVVGTGGSAFRSYTAKDTTSHVFNFTIDVPESAIPMAGLEFYVQNDTGTGGDEGQETIGLVRVKRSQLEESLGADGLLSLADALGGLDRLEVKVATAPSTSRRFKGTLDVARISGAFNGEINAGEVVDVVAHGEYRVGGALTTTRGLEPSALNFTDEPFRSGRHGAPLALVGSGGHFAGAPVAPCSQFVARTSGRLVVGINDRGRRGDSGDLTFEGVVRLATAKEWELREPLSKCSTAERETAERDEEPKETKTLAQEAKDLIASRGSLIAAMIQKIAHPTGRSPLLDSWNVTLEGETVAVTLDVKWSGGLTGRSYVTRVIWEFDRLRHIQAKITRDTAAIPVQPANASRLDSYFRALRPTVPVAVPGPSEIGECVVTTIKLVGNRQSSQDGVGSAGSGTAISYVNGLYQVSYSQDPAADSSRVGDEVRMCLVELPKKCPPGDNRGRVYKATNLRTGSTWTMPNSQHSCGGA